MGTAILPLDFETSAIRVVLIEGQPWFVAVDVCRVLEHTNVTVALGRLAEDEKQIIDPKAALGSFPVRGGAQTMNVVSESGLYALIFMSRKPTAERFRKWVTGEVLPAIRRDGYYLAGPEKTELQGKRDYYRALPSAHKERADIRAQALAEVEALIADGARVTAAIAEVAEEHGISLRSLWSYRRMVYMVPSGDWNAAMAPRWAGHQGITAECHPEAMRVFLDLIMSGQRVAISYRRVVEVAAENGWAPIPSQRTLNRVAKRVLPRQRPSAISHPSISKEVA